MPGRRILGRSWIGGGTGVLILTLLATGIGGHKWAVYHVEYYTADTARSTNCAACHFSARGGTILDRILQPRYHTPLEIVICPADGRLYVTAQDSNSVLIVDPGTRDLVAEIAVGHRPHSIVLDEKCTTAWVTNQEENTVSVIDLEKGDVVATLQAGFAPAGLARSAAGRFLYVANWFSNDISVIDLELGLEKTRLAAGRSPSAVVPSPDKKWMLVTNQLSFPSRRPHPPVSEVTLIDAEHARVARRFRLPGAHLLEGAAFSPDGDLALVTMVRPKNLLPVLQVERGWMMTNGLAVIDLNSGRVVQLLLDETDRFFADPSHIAITPDGRTAFVSHGGVDTVSVIDMTALRDLLEEIDSTDPDVYANHLGMSRRFVRGRIPTGANPRGLTVSPDGRELYVAERLDDRIAVIDIDRLELIDHIDLGGPRHVTLRRRGEQIFHSGDYTLQQQFSCRSCHPNSHVDGLAYDFEPDGLGRNIVDNRSLLGIDATGPFKWNGKNRSLYMQCGIRFARFLMRREPFSFGDLNALVAYLSSLPAPPTRHATAGFELTPEQQRGQTIFERPRNLDGKVIPESNRCSTCHPAPYYTNRKTEIVGSASSEDRINSFDTPQLNNVANTAPYLHDGKALTLEEIWTLYSPDDTHGVTSDLGKDGLNDLIEYLKTL